MNIGKIGKKSVVVAPTDMNVREVSLLMKEHNLGDIIIVEDDNKPVGIITDRDIVVKIVASGVDPEDMTASDIMSSELLILKEYQEVQDALDMMCAKKVRRAPIVNGSNNLVGIISADDLALLIHDEVESYGKLIRKQISPLSR